VTPDAGSPLHPSLLPLDPGIVVIRGRQVLLDQGLARAYGVSTKALNQAVKRNAGRFPEDFAFRLVADELAALRSQIVTSNAGRGGARYLPLAFTEHGAIMAASVLNSSRAIEMSVFVVRAFVRLRDLARTNAEIGKHLALLERRVTAHDGALKEVFSAIRGLLQPTRLPRKQIGFRATST
jgi:hypothetical protein